MKLYCHIYLLNQTNLSEEKQNQIIESLYSTGFFNDILLIIDDVLFVGLKRDRLFRVFFDGEKSFSEEN